MKMTRKNMLCALATPLLTLGLLAGTASAQTTPAKEVKTAAGHVKQDVRTVVSNVKQDVRDVANGDLRGAHERHKRVIRSTHQRHRDALRGAHERRMTAVQCLARHGHTQCVKRGYRYGHKRHACKTASGHWVLCSRPGRA